MPDRNTSSATNPDTASESFGDLLSQYEQSHAQSGQQREATVISVSSDTVYLDIGYKVEGVLPLSVFTSANEQVNPGDRLNVSVKGRNAEGYYELSRARVARPTDWTSLERAYTEKAPIIGTVTAVVKGGVTVDVGVRAFMPASRTGTRDAAEMEKLVGQEVRVRITKLDVTNEDVVVDRRALVEEEERAGRERRLSEIREGDVVEGTVASLTDYGAFVEIGGGVNALLHVGDIAWHRVNAPADVLTVGQKITAKVIKVDSEHHKIGIGMKQLEPHPWDAVPGKYHNGDRVRGTVTRLADFGAFVEIEPGVEGLVHVSEMSWAKRVRKPSDLLKVGDNVEVVILGVNPAERRLSLGLKQALGDPWSDAAQRYAAGAVVEGPVTSITDFGAFVQISEGIEGMIHVSEMSAEKRINHPRDMLRLNQNVRAQVLAIDPQKRQIRLSMKSLVPTGLDEFIAERKVGDTVTGRIVELKGPAARVELGEGIIATCTLPETATAPAEAQPAAADLSALTSMLKARWKGSDTGTTSKQVQSAQTGQVRSFRIHKLDPATKSIEVELQ